MRRPSLLGMSLIVGLIGTAAALAGSDVRASYGARVTGDEPQYLITAISLWEDRSLDVGDEIRAERYRAWHEVPLDPQTRPLEDGSEISPHDPLLPALLALPMRIGGWWAAKATMALTAGALAALLVWTAVARLAVPRRWAAITVGIFAASSPLAVYGSQIYPEVPAALAVACVVAAVTGSLRPAAVGLCAVAVVVLPWLSVKYVPVAAVLAVLVVARLWRAGKKSSVAVLFVAWFAAALGFAAAHWAWYGGWTPYATGDHFVNGEFQVVGQDPNYFGRSTRLIGLLVDRTFGLAAWQPAWLLAIPAVAAMVVARVRHSAILVSVAAVGWLNATFIALTMHGWWWPGRQVVVVLPALVLAIAWWVGRHRAARSVLAAAGLAGIVAFGWVVVEGLAGRLTWVVDFASTTYPLYRAARFVLPGYMNPGTATWVLHGAWVAAAIALAWWGWASVKIARNPARRSVRKSRRSARVFTKRTERERGKVLSR
jgi:hypothetical protein